MSTVRSFVALDLPDYVVELLASTANDLLGRQQDVQWTRPGNLHLTLKFLGDLQTLKIDKIFGVIHEVASGHGPVSLSLGSVGAFPDRRRAKVIWVGLDGVVQPLIDLHCGIDQALSSVGFKREQRAFRPHLTLGRSRSGTTIRDDIAVPDCAFVCEQVSLVRSDLRPDGAQYSTLHSADLGKTR